MKKWKFCWSEIISSKEKWQHLAWNFENTIICRFRMSNPAGDLKPLPKILLCKLPKQKPSVRYLLCSYISNSFSCKSSFLLIVGSYSKRRPFRFLMLLMCRNHAFIMDCLHQQSRTYWKLHYKIEDWDSFSPRLPIYHLLLCLQIRNDILLPSKKQTKCSLFWNLFTL